MNNQTNLDVLQNKTVLVTGGTGSFGQRFTEIALKDHAPKKLIIFSRDELKQFEMQKKFGDDKRIRFFLGDIRDMDRLRLAFRDVDIVMHAAALKQVPMLEYNPFEAVKTNIIGAQNIIQAAIDQNVTRVIALSTDKAVNPVNLYGATKLGMEKLFVAGNAYVGNCPTRFSVVRYGNVVGSRGSVIPFFLEKRSTGVLSITDDRMTRFWITLDQAVALVFSALEHMQGGEIVVPKIPSMKILELAKAIGPNCKLQIIGIRPGEKLHEVMLTEDESRNTLELADRFVIEPNHSFWDAGGTGLKTGKRVPINFRYSSDSNTQWLSADQLTAMLDQLGLAKTSSTKSAHATLAQR